ncbi:hypothetical protein [Anatilimnocola floriformis]|uniref:hypothetical protein n=1 Tax=Anatilimnocola floriformis TaxID=2948575 RepID=UPI0020C49E21|nr:hypothetical protein [Anatilimnocola floriformis]
MSTNVPTGHIYCRLAWSAYNATVLQILNDVRLRVRSLEKCKTPDDGLLGALLPFRILLANAPVDVSGCLAKAEVEFWKKEFLGWFERTKSKFPENIDSQVVLTCALSEFEALREIAVDIPDFLWQSNAIKGMRILEKQRGT